MILPCSSPVGSSPAPLYNMGATCESQKREYFESVDSEPISRVDKLRLAFVSPVLSPSSPSLIDLVGGSADLTGTKRMRNQGSRSVVRHWVRFGTDLSGIYMQADVVEHVTTVLCVVEFNPAKLSDVEWDGLGRVLRLVGARSPVWVDRFDFAVDYALRRGYLVLDDRGRVADYFGVGCWGPETERTGYRKGSRLKVQLYDKGAEVASKSGEVLREDCSRFEVQCIKPPSLRLDRPLLGEYRESALRLEDLPEASWPGGSATVRFFRWDPATVSDELLSWAALALRGNGIRAVLRNMRERRWPRARIEQYLHCIVPEVDPSPRDVWGRAWRGIASDVSQRVLALCSPV